MAFIQQTKFCLFITIVYLAFLIACFISQGDLLIYKTKPVLSLVDMCGINLTSAAGLVSSPNYPDYYPPNEDCNITVSGDEKPIHLTFHAFDVGSDE